MDYTFKYRLQTRPEARNDGSSQVAHEIWVIASSDGESWVAVPSHHKTILVGAASLKVAMDMPHDTGQERQAKNVAYKELLKANRNTQPMPLSTNWMPETLESFMDANDAATLEADRIDAYIVETLGQTYPVDFSL